MEQAKAPHIRDDAAEIASEIRDFLKDTGMSATALSREIGDASLIAGILDGSRDPRVSSLRKIREKIAKGQGFAPLTCPPNAEAGGDGMTRTFSTAAAFSGGGAGGATVSTIPADTGDAESAGKAA